MTNTKVAISPIIATVLLVVVAVILVTVIISFGKGFTTDSLDKTNDIKELSSSDAEHFVYPKTFNDGIIQFNYSPPAYLKTDNIVITRYRIFTDDNQTAEVILDSNCTLISGQNILSLSDFSDLNITDNKFDIQLCTSDGQYIMLKNITNPYVSPTVGGGEEGGGSVIPEGVGAIPINGQIWYLEHLDYIDTNTTTLAGAYTLMRDLNFNDNSSYFNVANKTTWTTGTGFTPIGTSAARFTGHFDGNNFTISNLYINKSDTNYVGLFGYIIYSNITPNIYDLSLEEINVVGNYFVGGLVGNNGGYITNVSTSGTILGVGYVGGFTGVNEKPSIDWLSANIIDSSTSGTVTGTGNYVGGFSGYNSDGTISNCNSTNDVTGINSVAGFIGYMYGREFGYIEKSYATGNVSGIDLVGGFLGSTGSYGDIYNCYATGDVSGNSYVGGFLGRSYGYTSADYSYSKGHVIGSTNVGGFAGSGGGSENYSYYDTNKSGKLDTGNGTPKTTTQMKQQATFTGWNFTTDWNIYEGGTYPYLRNNIEHLIPGITSPVDGSTIYNDGYPTNFIGIVINPQGSYTCSWDSNVGGNIGTGCNLSAVLPGGLGRHKITLSVTDNEQTKTSVIYVTKSLPH